MTVEMRGIDELPSGKWRVRIALGGRRKTIGIYETLDSAVRMRDAAYGELAAGTMVLSSGMTIAQWAPSWLWNHRRHLRAYSSDRQRFNSHVVASSLGPKVIQDVTSRDIREWLKELAAKKTAHKYGSRPAKPLSRQTRKHCLNLLRAFFEATIEEDFIAANPCSGVKLKEPARIVPDDWYLSPEEQHTLLDSIEGPEKWIVAFAIGTGLRQGEQWNLHLTDLHVDGSDPHAFVRYGSNGKPPKNGKTRKVPLFGLGLEAARHWLKELPTYAPHNPHGLVFPTPAIEIDGRRPHEGGSRRTKAPACWSAARSKVKRLRVWWHLLRHTCASSLVAGWWGRKWSLDEVRAVMGHSSIVVTERYAHLADSALRDVAALTNAEWSRGGHAGAPEAGRSSLKFKYARQESNLRHSASKAPGTQAISYSYKRNDHAVTIARNLLEKTAAGSADWRALAEDLAASILARRDVRLALQLASGDITPVRAIELAEIVAVIEYDQLSDNGTG